MIRTVISLIILFVTVFPAKIYAAGKKESIAVFDFKLKNISPDAGNIVRNRIEYNLFQTRKFNLLERNRIDIISKEKKLSEGDSKSIEDTFQAGKLLPADYVITGDMTFKEKIHVNIVLMDTSNGTIIHSFSKTYQTETALIEDADKIASLISEEILFNREFDRDKEDFNLSSIFFLNMGASYIPNAGKLSEYADNGYMIALDAGVRNVLMNGIRMGFQLGYAHFYTTENIDYISISPFQYTIAYELQPYRKYFINAGAGFGTAHVTVKNKHDVMKEFEACGLLFIELKYHIKSNLAFIMYGNHYILFENDGNVDFTAFGGGFERSSEFNSIR